MGVFSVEVNIKWDIYTCDSSHRYNHFRVDRCSNVSGLQQWSAQAISVAAKILTGKQASHNFAKASSAHPHNTPPLEPLCEPPTSTASKFKQGTVQLNPSNSSNASSLVGLSMSRHTLRMQHAQLLSCCVDLRAVSRTASSTARRAWFQKFQGRDDHDTAML